MRNGAHHNEADQLAVLARASLEKQHARVCDVMRALVQYLEFIRPSDWTEQERKALEFAKSYLQEQERRKPMGTAEEMGPRDGVRPVAHLAGVRR